VQPGRYSTGWDMVLGIPGITTKTSSGGIRHVILSDASFSKSPNTAQENAQWAAAAKSANEAAAVIVHVARAHANFGRYPPQFREDVEALMGRPARENPAQVSSDLAHHAPCFMSVLHDALVEVIKVHLRLVDIFKQFDADHDGKLTYGEDLAVVRKLVPSATNWQLVYTQCLLDVEEDERKVGGMDGVLTLAMFRSAVKYAQTAELAVASGGAANDEARVPTVEKNLRNVLRSLKKTEIGTEVARRNLSILEVTKMLKLIAMKASAQELRITLAIAAAVCISESDDQATYDDSPSKKARGNIFVSSIDADTLADGMGISIETLYHAVRLHNHGPEDDGDEPHNVTVSPDTPTKSLSAESSTPSTSPTPRTGFLNKLLKRGNQSEEEEASNDIKLPSSILEGPRNFDDDEITSSFDHTLEMCAEASATIIGIASGTAGDVQARKILLRPDYHRVAMRDIMSNMPRLFTLVDEMVSLDPSIKASYRDWMRAHDWDEDGKLIHSENLSFLRQLLPHASTHDIVYLHAMMDMHGDGHIATSGMRAILYSCKDVEQMVSRGGMTDPKEFGKHRNLAKDVEDGMTPFLEALQDTVQGRLAAKKLLNVVEIALLIRKLVPDATLQSTRISIAIAEALTRAECVEEIDRHKRVIYKGTSLEAFCDALKQYNVNGRLVNLPADLKDELNREERIMCAGIVSFWQSLDAENKLSEKDRHAKGVVAARVAMQKWVARLENHKMAYVKDMSSMENSAAARTYHTDHFHHDDHVNETTEKHMVRIETHKFEDPKKKSSFFSRLTNPFRRNKKK